MVSCKKIENDGVAGNLLDLLSISRVDAVETSTQNRLKNPIQNEKHSAFSNIERSNNMAFNKTARKGNNSGNGTGFGGGSETVAVRLKSVHLVDTNYINEKRAPQKNKDDYIIATLLQPAFGLDVVRGENGESLTEVKIKLREQRSTNPDKQGYGLADFRKGAKKDSGPKMGANPIIILENASRDFKTDEISCGWLHCGMPDSRPEQYPELGPVIDETTQEVTKPAVLDHIHVNAWVQVQEEKDAKDRTTGEAVKRQNRLMLLTDLAAPVADKQDLLESQVINYLYDDPSHGGGSPFLVIRLCQINPPMTMGAQTIWPSYNEDGTPKEPVEVVQDFLARQVEEDESPEKDSNFDFYLENIAEQNAAENSEGYIIEVIPGYRFSTGKKSLPSAMKPGRRLDSDSFKSFRLDDEGNPIAKENTGELLMSQMYTRAHLTIKRGEFENGIGPWYATGTHAVRPAFNGQPNKRAEFHSIFDIPTDVTPPEVVAHFASLAAKRQSLASDLQPKKDATADAESHSDDQIPDHTGGLTPN